MKKQSRQEKAGGEWLEMETRGGSRRVGLLKFGEGETRRVKAAARETNVVKGTKKQIKKKGREAVPGGNPRY